MSLHSITWQAALTATSSISHGGQTRGVTTLLRREKVLREGEAIWVPIVSGNAWRGRLRRLAEELFREVIDYTDEDLPLPAVDTLRTGGSLAKTGTPLTGSRLRTARDLIPPLALFGAATGGRTVEGALSVGKLMPVLVETAHLTGIPTTAPTVFTATQLETYTRQDDQGSAARVAAAPRAVPVDPGTGDVDEDRLPLEDAPGSDFTLFRIETFPAGTTFASWLQAQHLTGEQLRFLLDLLDRWSTHATIGGRSAIGHGRLEASLTPRPGLPADLPDWRPRLTQERPAVLEALRMLT